MSEAKTYKVDNCIRQEKRSSSDIYLVKLLLQTKFFSTIYNSVDSGINLFAGIHLKEKDAFVGHILKECCVLTSSNAASEGCGP